MALPSSGPISLSQVNVELGLSATAQISLNQANVRTLAGVPSGVISMQNLRGKANQFAFSIASNQTNANLATLATNAGWNGTAKLFCTINSGIYVSSNSTATPALTVSGAFLSGVEITNNGFIIGMGGAGGSGATGASVSGGGGGIALFVASGVSIRNNGTIGGGGGGGGLGGGRFILRTGTEGGGGGGGGRTGVAANSAGGLGFAGSAGTGGTGGAGTVSAPGVGGTPRGGGGGGWGASGVNGEASTGQGGTGGAGGAAVSGNSNITWLATGTRLGAIT